MIRSCDWEGMSKTSIGHLEDQIEQLVREHIAASRRAASAAVERAFAGARATSPIAARVPRTRRAAGRRRASEEVSALGERLYEAVVANPGALMTVLAPLVGATARELHRPATLLRRAGRVRSVGERQETRYFPMVSKKAMESRS